MKTNGKTQKIYYCESCQGLTNWEYLGRGACDMSDLYTCMNKKCGTTIHESILRERTNKVIRNGLEVNVEVE